MARLGLSRWLQRSRKTSNLSSNNRFARLRRWFYRPIVEQLEDRLAPGSIVVAITELLHGGPDDPYAEMPDVVARSGDLATTAAMDRATTSDRAPTAQEQDAWPIYVAPQAPPLPSTAGQDLFLQQEVLAGGAGQRRRLRSEEHTSELQSR